MSYYIVRFWRDNNGAALADHRVFDNREEALKCQADLQKISKRKRKDGQVFASESYLLEPKIGTDES